MVGDLAHHLGLIQKLENNHFNIIKKTNIMKTIKKSIVVVAVVSIIVICAMVSRQSVGNVKTSLQESTHQGYRTMVADFIF